MYSAHNEGKSVIAERFIRPLINDIYRYMTLVSKYVYNDKLNDTVNKHNNKYYNAIKMKPIDVRSNTYIDSSKEINNNIFKFKIGDTVRVSKYNSIFTKVYNPNWSEEVFVIKKVKNTVPWKFIINEINGEEFLGTFYENKLQKTNKKEFRIEKVINRKSDKLYVKWKEYDSLFNS